MKQIKIIVVSVLVFLPLTTFAIDDDNCLCSCVCRESDQTGETNINLENIDYSEDIIISEIFPNPEGDDAEAEFVELYNTGEEKINLLHWKVGDSAKKYKINPDDYGTTIIEPEDYFIIYREFSGIALNNSGEETVYLYQPNDFMLDAVVYSDSEEDKSISLLDDDNWYWTEATPMNKNIKTDKEEEQEEDEPGEKEEETNYSDKIIISEIFPNPEGSDSETEFVELYNVGDTEIDLTDWYISDATTKKYKLKQIINPGEYLAVMRADSGVALNNTDDQAELYFPNGELVEKIEYTKASESQSYSLIDVEWSWTEEVTPGLANVLFITGDEEVSEEEQEAQQIISKTSFSLPPTDKTKQIMYGLGSAVLAALVSLGVVGTKLYKKKLNKRSN